MELMGRVAVITGSSKGIGLAVARQLIEEGATIALLDKDQPPAPSVQIDPGGTWKCDVSVREEVKAVMDQVKEAYGSIDILINNAGIWRHTPVQKIRPAQWDEVFDVNVKGLLWCSQMVIPNMIQNGSGKIVNIASVAGFGGNSDWSAYCASKAAAISLTLAWADAVNNTNVQVNAVCPGTTQTDLLDSIRRAQPQSQFNWIHNPEEVAKEAIQLVNPFEQKTNGRIVAMKPADTVLGQVAQKRPEDQTGDTTARIPDDAPQNRSNF